jgi:gamma-glutamyltranspeptidase
MPNKRPYHTIIPSMLTHAQDNTLLGVMGAMVGCTLRGSLLGLCVSCLHVLAMVVVYR